MKSWTWKHWLVGYILVFVAISVIPDTFIAFMVGVVGTGMCAVNLGIAGREARAARRPMSW